MTLGCRHGVFNEIWYHYDVRGSVQTGDFVPSDPDGTKSTCPSSGIRYLPKHGGSHPTATVTVPVPTGTSTPGAPFSGKGHLNVKVGGSDKGCIISPGTWFTSGTCATFKAASAGEGFLLTSSKGKCAVVSGALKCGHGVRYATGFTSIDDKLAVGGNAAWSADKVARGHGQEKVYAGDDHGTSLEIVWQSV